MQIDPFTLDFSLQAAGVLFFIWLGQRLVDTVASRVIDKKVFQRIFARAAREIKIIKTRGDPVGATFSLSYTPEEDLTIASATDRLETAFKHAEQSSGGKISIVSQHWDEKDRKGNVEIEYSDKTEKFTVKTNLIQDTESLRKAPSGSPDDVLVGSIGMEIEFDFPFHLLEDTLFNLSSLTNYLEDGYSEQIRGSFSGGRFVISPVKNDLTIDEWIEEERFDISLLLSSKDESGTEVEFFPDRAIIKSKQREIDAMTVSYVRELLLNYYL